MAYIVEIAEIIDIKELFDFKFVQGAGDAVLVIVR